MARQLLGVPRDVHRIVAHEIAHVQRVPQWLVGLKRHGIQGHQHQRLALAGLHLGVGVGRAAAQGAQGVAVQVFQQLALPGVPDLGAGAADVGHGQQVQGGQVALGAHAFGKRGNHVRVAQVRLLRNAAHRQVLVHQKLDEPGVFSIDAVLAAKAPCVHRAQHRMVAATALGNVMEQRGHVQDVGLVPTCAQLRAEGVFMRMLGHEKPPHIA